MSFLNEGSREAKDAQAGFDSVFHALTRGAMRMWTRLLLRDPKSSTQEARADKSRLVEDQSSEEPAIAS